MDLILLRHGKAENTSNTGDFGRVLVPRGREQARRAGCLVKGGEMLPEIVLTSPLVRARQTADEFCGAAGIPGPILQGWLASGMSPATAVSELGAFREFQRVAIIGHEPDLSRLIEWLLGTAAGAVEVKKGTLAGVRFHPPGRHGSLLFLVPPKLTDDLGE